MNALAMAAAPAIGVTMYQHLGYKSAFIIATGFSVSVIFLIQFVHDKGEPISLEEQMQPASPQKIEILDKKALPLAMIIMLFAIPYCATQSFWVSYVSVQKLDVIVSLFFPAYAIILFILRLSLRNLFDKKPFSFFMTASSISAGVSMLLLSIMQNNIFMFLAAAFMAGGYGIMCSVCQSTAILLAGEEKRGLANSTYYIGLDSGMALGPIIGGMLYGNVDIHYFYPFLLTTVPLGILVYWLNRFKFSRK